MSEQELRRRLLDAVPEPPADPSRAANARRLATRRRHRVVVATGVAVVMLAIGVPVALTQQGEHRADPAPANQVPTEKVLDCPAPATGSTPPDSLAGNGADSLEPGATTARLCRPGGIAWQPPADELDEGVSELVKLVNRTPVFEPTDRQVCPSNLGPTWGVLFGYPDGSTRFVTAAAYGCEGITVGGVTRGGWDDARALVQRFVALLLAQRGGREPAEPINVPLSCGGTWMMSDMSALSVLGNDPQPALTSAILCWKRDTNSDEPIRTSRISADELRILLADMAAHRTARPPEASSCASPRIQLRILGSNAWGDRFAFFEDCGEFLVADGPGSSYWKPGEAAQRILDNLVAAQDEPLAMPDADTPPDQVVARWSDLAIAGDPRADGLWDGKAPDIDATKLQLKVDAVRETTVTAGNFFTYEVDALVSDSEVGGCPVYREMTFRLGRWHPDDPWKILDWTEKGHESGGC